MIIDKQLILSAAQAITGSAASENIYDTGSAADVGPGRDLKVVLSVNTTIDNLTSLDISLQTHDDDAFGAQKVLWKVNALAAALVAGAKINLPGISAGCQRYLRLYYTVNGTNPSAGAVTAAIVLDDQQNTPTSG